MSGNFNKDNSKLLRNSYSFELFLPLCLLSSYLVDITPRTRTLQSAGICVVYVGLRTLGRTLSNVAPLVQVVSFGAKDLVISLGVQGGNSLVFLAILSTGKISSLGEGA